MSEPKPATPVWHWQQANALLEEIVAHKDDKDFHAVDATLLTHASIAHSLQGLLAAKILDQL